jgi:hypothetical protein
VTIYAHGFWAWYPFRRRPWVWPLVAGAILPDLPYCAFFAAAAVERGPRAFTDLALWRSIWGHPVVVALHSFLPWGVAMLLLISTRGWRRSPGVAAFVAGWGSHVVIDMLTLGATATRSSGRFQAIGSSRRCPTGSRRTTGARSRCCVTVRSWSS